MKYEPRFKKGDHVLYNSLSTAGAAHGVITQVDNSTEPHMYTVEPDIFKGERKDMVEEQHIQERV